MGEIYNRVWKLKITEYNKSSMPLEIIGEYPTIISITTSIDLHSNQDQLVLVKRLRELNKIVEQLFKRSGKFDINVEPAEEEYLREFDFRYIPNKKHG